MWLDTFIAVPLIGLQTAPNFGALYKYPERLQPLLDEVVARDSEVQVGVEPAGGFQFRTKRGFAYKVLLDNVIVEFTYSASDKRLAGHRPAIELPPVESFGALLEETVDQAARVVSLLSASEPLRVRRVGLLASALMEKSKAPPGVADMIGRHGSFFSGDLIKAESTFVVDLDRAEDPLPGQLAHDGRSFGDPHRELVQELPVRKGRLPARQRREPLRERVCALEADLRHLAQALRAHVGHVHARRERAERVVGADVGRRLLAPDVLFTRGKRKHEPAAPLLVVRGADEAAG